MGEEDEEKDSDAGEKPGTAGRVQEEKQGRNQRERLTPFPFLFFHPLPSILKILPLSFLPLHVFFFFFFFFFLDTGTNTSKSSTLVSSVGSGYGHVTKS